jgi:phospholipase C
LKGLHVLERRITTAALTVTIATVALSTMVAVSQARVPKRPIPSFDHVVVIVFENKRYEEVLGSSNAPSFNGLARRYAFLTAYEGVAHPSLPNYLALIAGSTFGIDADCTHCEVDARNLADTLEAAGKSWKTYAEGLPAPGFTGSSAGQYVKKHVPFLYFRDVVSSQHRRKRVVPLTRFRRDLDARALPSFSLVIPDLCNDMHDCSVAVGDNWLRTFLAPLLKSRDMARGVVFVVFDESHHDDVHPNRVPALALGPLIRPGSSSSASLSHYSLLRTIEDSWRLPRLGKSRAARPITGIWR